MRPSVQLTSGGFDLWPFQLKIGTSLTRALVNVYTNFDFFSQFFLFSSYVPGRDRWTDGRTYGGARRVVQPIGRPHNKLHASTDAIDVYNCKSREHSLERIPPPRIFVFCSWLSVGIAIVNKEYCKKFVDLNCDLDPGTLRPDRDPDCHHKSNRFFFGLCSSSPHSSKNFVKIRS